MKLLNIILLLATVGLHSAASAATPLPPATVVAPDSWINMAPNGRRLGSVEQLYWNLRSGTKPAEMKDTQPTRIQGEYVAADLAPLLHLIGRIPRIRPEVEKVRFLEGFAASVTVPHFVFLCSKDKYGLWQIVGGYEQDNE